MQVLGARFATQAAAGSALREIRATVPVPADAVGERPLGSTHYEAPPTEYLLAGRFEDHESDAAASIVEQHGGILFTLRSETPRERRNPAPVTPATQAPVAAVIRAGHLTGLRRPAAVRSRGAREQRRSCTGW
jgi:hypothetical protein